MKYFLRPNNLGVDMNASTEIALKNKANKNDDRLKNP